MSFYLNCASILIFLEEHACLNYLHCTIQSSLLPKNWYMSSAQCSVWAKGYFPACADQVIQGSLTLT